MFKASLSVFFPAFNEEANIKQTVEEALVVLKKLKIKHEILIVDDGSTDMTGQVADSLAKKYEQVQAIHQPNGGYGQALKTGFNNASYDWIAYTDSDGQFDFSEITSFLDQSLDYDLILGYRIKRSDPPIRNVFALGWKLSLFAFFGLTLKDIDCGFKMMKREVWKKISPISSSRGAMVNAEIIIKAKKNHFKITQVGVNHYPRKKGTPTGASLKVILNSYRDLFRLFLQNKKFRFR